MFKRAAGWLILSIRGSYINHYFNENQTKALCGTDDTVRFDVSPQPVKSFKTCKRCEQIIVIPPKGPKKPHGNCKPGGNFAGRRNYEP